MEGFISNIISIVLIFILGFFSVWIKKFLSNFGDPYTEQDSIIMLGTDIIEQAAAATVGKLEQTVGKELRERIAAGLADKTELLKLALDAFDEVKAALPKETYEALCKSMDNVDLFIQNKIETELLKLKNGLKKAQGV